MKVSVLGADDCVGTRLIESFHLGGGPSVTAIVRHPDQLARAARFSVDLRVADVFDIDSLARAFSGGSAAVHAMPVDPPDLKRSVVTFCRAAAQAGLRRVIYVSSADVHGLSPVSGTTEKSALHLGHASPHVNALITAERQFETETRSLGLLGVVLRPGLIYGARAPFFAQVATELVNEQVWLAERGVGICNCVALDNVVAAIRQALKAKLTSNLTSLVLDEETITWRGFYETVAHGVGVSPRTFHHVADSTASPVEPRGRLESGASSSVSASPLPPTTLSETMAARQRSAWKLPTDGARRDLAAPGQVSFAEGLRQALAWWRYAQGEFSTAA